MTVLGIDISKWDGNWNANAAKQAGAVFVYIKASQATYTDPNFASNWQKAKAAGLLRGAFHYLDYTQPGTSQATYFANLLKADPGELPPAVDYEQNRSDNNPALALPFIKDFLTQMLLQTQVFQKSTFKAPMIYTSPGFWAQYGEKTNADYWMQFPLWLANYTTASTPQMPSPWPTWLFWQFTAKGPGQVYGSECLSIDVNQFNGTLSELSEIAGQQVADTALAQSLSALTQRVTTLEQEVAANSNSTSSSALSTLANQFGTMQQSLTDLTLRMTSVEQKVTVLQTASIPTSSATGSTASQISSSTGNTASSASGSTAGSSTGSSSQGASTGGTASSASGSTAGSSTGSSSQGASTGGTTSTAASSTTSQTDSSVFYAVCTNPALNVRSGPGASYPMVAGLTYGQQVTVLKILNGWAQIESPAGWVNETYLSFVTSPSSTPIASTTQSPAALTYGICNTSGLNIRSGPGVTYPVAGALVYGQKVTILSAQNGWAQIQTPAGWCNMSYLSTL
jgi:lysozyme